MRHDGVASAVLALMVLGLPGWALADEKKPIVAVFKIENRGTALKTIVLERLTSYLAAKLTESGQYEVVPQDKLKEVLVGKKKESFKQCYEQSCQIEIGQELAANRVLATQAMKVGTKCVVTCHLYDLKKATSGSAATAKGECGEEGIMSAIDEVMAKLAKPPPPPPSPPPVAPSPTPPSKGWIGLNLKDSSDGVRVVGVNKGGPADKAGVLMGDVLVAAGDEPVTSGGQFAKSIHARPPGTQVALALRRHGKRLQVTVVLADFRHVLEVPPVASSPTPADEAWLGLKLKDSSDGVRVVRVNKGGPADKAGVLKGDVLVATGDEPVTSWGQFAKWIRARQPGTQVAFALRRQGKRLQVTVVLADLQHVFEGRKKGCAGGAPKACTALGRMHLEGGELPKDLVRAVAYFRLACDGGHLPGCTGLAKRYRTGQGVGQDLGKAVELYRKACDGGVMTACNELGVMVGAGKGVAKDRVQSAALYRKACDRNLGLACRNLGWRYQRGDGVAKDLTQATTCFRKACEHGDDEGCKQLRAPRSR